MQSVDVVSYFTQALYLVLWLSLPPIAVGALVGTLFSLFQALTQIQEQTLGFVVKLIAVAATLLLSMNWLGGEMYNYTVSILDAIPTVGK